MSSLTVITSYSIHYTKLYDTFTGPQFEAITRKELNVVGSWMNYSAPFPGTEWKTAAWMMEAGLIKVDALQTHTFPVERIQEAYDVIYQNKELWSYNFV